MLTLNSTLVKY